METKRPEKRGGYQEGQENNGSHVLWQPVPHSKARLFGGVQVLHSSEK